MTPLPLPRKLPRPTNGALAVIADTVNRLIDYAAAITPRPSAGSKSFTMTAIGTIDEPKQSVTQQTGGGLPVWL